MDAKFKSTYPHWISWHKIYILFKKKIFRQQKNLSFSWHQANPYLNSLLPEIASIDYTWDIKLCAQRYYTAICLLQSLIELLKTKKYF